MDFMATCSRSIAHYFDGKKYFTWIPLCTLLILCGFSQCFDTLNIYDIVLSDVYSFPVRSEFPLWLNADEGFSRRLRICSLALNVLVCFSGQTL